MDKKNILMVVLGVALIGAATFFVVYKFVLGNPESVASNPPTAVTTPMPTAGTPEETETPATETSTTSENGQVILYNLDSNDRSKRLSGGVITVKNETSGESTTETFSENGEINLSLPVGKYTLNQIKSADGYELMSAPISLDVGEKEGENDIPTISQEILNNKVEDVAEVSTATAEAVAEATPTPETTQEETQAEATQEEASQAEETETPSVAEDTQQTNPNNPKTADVTNKFNASFVYFVFAYGILAYSFVYIKKNILKR